MRLAITTTALWLVWWLTGTHHISGAGELGLFINAAGGALFWGGFVWVAYMAIEPSYRRSWPRQLVAWARVVGGRFRDPVVGRDVLLGVVILVGMAFGFAFAAANPVIGATIVILLAAVSFVLLFRFGVLFFVVYTVVNMALLRFTLTTDISSWYFGNTVFVVLVLGGLAAYGFHTSLAGKSVFGNEAAEAVASA